MKKSIHDHHEVENLDTDTTRGNENSHSHDGSLLSLHGHTKGIRCLAFHPCVDNVIVSGSLDASVKLWDIKAGQLQQTIHASDAVVFNLSFNYDGSLLATITRDKVSRCACLC
jgi:WD40 repeat protein